MTTKDGFYGCDCTPRQLWCAFERVHRTLLKVRPLFNTRKAQSERFNCSECNVLTTCQIGSSNDRLYNIRNSLQIPCQDVPSLWEDIRPTLSPSHWKSCSSRCFLRFPRFPEWVARVLYQDEQIARCISKRERPCNRVLTCDPTLLEALSGLFLLVSAEEVKYGLMGCHSFATNGLLKIKEGKPIRDAAMNKLWLLIIFWRAVCKAPSYLEKT